MSESPKLDVLSKFLASLSLSSKVFAMPTVCGNWKIDTTGTYPAQFHYIARGSCWLHMKQLAQPMHLRAGDLIAVLHGDWHVLSGSPDLSMSETSESGHQNHGAFTSIICGAFQFTDRAHKMLIDVLPAYLALTANQLGDRFSLLMKMLTDEGIGGLQGSSVILDRLSDVLLIIILRHHFETTQPKEGLLAALADTRLNTVMNAMHRQPGEKWTIEKLATLGHLSRSSFIEYFSKTLGETPMQYLTQVRMQEAERLARDTSWSVARIANEIGYATESAFRHAYKRSTGKKLGLLRRA